MKNTDTWNFENLVSADEHFDSLKLSEKLICAFIANCNMELDQNQLLWLLNDIAKRNMLDEDISIEQVSVYLKELITDKILKEDGNRYMVEDIYYPSAYRFPLYFDVEKFSLSLNSFALSSEYSFEFSCRQNFFSNLLINLLSGNISNDIFSSFDYSFLNNQTGIPLLSKVLEPFDENWFEGLPENSQVFLFNYAVYYEILNFKNVLSYEGQNIFKYFMRPKWYKSELFLSEGAHNLALYLIFCGNFERAKSYLDISTSIEVQGINAFLVYLFHGSVNSLPVFHEAMKQLQKKKSKRNITFYSLADIFYFISMLQDGSSESLYEAVKYIEKLDKMPLIFKPAYNVLHEFYWNRTIGKCNREKVLGCLAQSNCPFLIWLSSFVSLWAGCCSTNEVEETVLYLIEKSKDTELTLIYSELLKLAQKAEYKTNINYEKELENWNNNFIIPFIDRVDQKQKWEYILDELSAKLNLSTTNKESTIRLIWDLRLDIESSSVKLFPKEQQKLKNGNWSVGKPVSLDIYFEDLNPFPDFYTEQDKRIYRALQKLRPWLTGNGDQTWQILPHLANCPKVFLNENYKKPIEVIKGDPVLMLRENENGLYFEFQPAYKGNPVIAVMENESRLKIFEFTKEELETANILSSQEIFPKAAINKIKEIIAGLNKLMPVHTTVEGTKALTPIASIAASSIVYAELEPIANGLKVRFCIKPFGINGPAFIPGKGEADVFTDIAGQHLHTKRNLELEKNNYRDILEDCPMLIGEVSDECSALFSTPDDSLDLLLNLKDIPDLVIEWPENTKPKKVVAASFSNFSFRVKNFNEWFTLEGELKVDENHIIDLQKILKHYEKGSRFIQIEEDQFLAITEEFRKQIEDIQAFTKTDDQQSIFHASTIQLMDDILKQGSKLTFDKTWHEMLTHIRHASEKKFIVPSEFKADLREYQNDGFKWLSRMAYLGMGACLADDMGLGKTVEALSIITSRADKGPAFVLAPTSVCMNWYQECKRFAPTLNPILFAQSDRKETINNLKPNDLIICSYGVLQREIEDLGSVNWSTVVLDEAQAIKNMATNRSQAAMTLKGQFKMLMTGTPIENHLGELWNLFRFLNPGFLGTINEFNEKFAVPIQSFNDKRAQERLKKLVQPFILRRTKNQVLKDLPARTEVILNVELSQKEAEVYESFRRQAMDNIKKSSGKDKNTDAKPMIVLAEIMRLRRLCCNPSLVVPDMNIESSKLNLLESITEELLASGHKALIFSQFVDHLSIIRKFFDEKGYKYQYLDGTTTQKARAKAIKDFQDGEGDFFLISLKAGGQGINLTAADYVIHMDPWWNPAVEDQASDRAHRIGQTRPVTIYKLITSNTIEEKIVQLHGKKRDLADGLLDGTDISGRISTSELISLINSSALSQIRNQ